MTMRRSPSPKLQPYPRLVLCAGLKSSASTWLYNAVIQILKAHARSLGLPNSRRRVAAFYADDPGLFPPDAHRAAFVVVKTHIPSPALLSLLCFVHGAAFITVREPRDAITSLMLRFGHGFEAALREVAAGSLRVVALAQARSMVLHYESRFFDRDATLGRVATHMGVPVSASTLHGIHRSLSRDKVRAKIVSLERRGAFGRKPKPDRFDRATHWHPGHVGDGLSQKYAGVLTAAQQRAVLAATRQYCAAFGYPGPSVRRPSRAGKPRRT